MNDEIINEIVRALIFHISKTIKETAMDARLVALQHLGEKVLNIYFSTGDKVRRQKAYDAAVIWFLERFEEEEVKENE